MHYAYYDMPKGTYQTEAMLNSEKNIKTVALAIVKSVSLVSQSV